MNPFEFINSINFTKENLMEGGVLEKDYSPWLVNRGLSYFPDTVMYANLMNSTPHLDNRIQYEFLLNIVSKKKRFSKWHKEEVSDSIHLVTEYYQISEREAAEYLTILTPAEIEIIKTKLSKGGRQNDNRKVRK